MLLKLTLDTNHSINQIIKEWRRAVEVPAEEFVVNNVAFEKISGVITVEGITSKVVGFRYINHEDGSDLEFLQANGVRIRYRNISPLSNTESTISYNCGSLKQVENRD